MRDRYGNLVQKVEQETQRALKLPKGKPEGWDGRPVSTFPGRKIKATPGQLSIDDQPAR